MSGKLKNDPQIRKLAYDLGLKPNGDAVSAILRFSTDRIRSYLKTFSCSTLSELLTIAAANLDTEMIEIHSDKDLIVLRDKMMGQRETGFIDIVEEFSSPDLFAVTIRRQKRKTGQRKFVSIIDCRGIKLPRRYFSKWHELAHLITLTDQLRLSYCRTHAPGEAKDPEEAMMDIIAGEVAFLPDVFTHHVSESISFQVIERIRESFCPEASFQAAVIGFAKAWPEPCILVQVDLGLKKAVEKSLDQYSFEFVKAPVPELRAVKVRSNPAAIAAGIFIYENMRVPEESIIHKVFSKSKSEVKATENLNSWETSNGERLKSVEVMIHVRRLLDGVYALIVPI